MFPARINTIKPIILKDGAVKVIQISDTHLFADDELDIFGVKSNLKFKEVIDKIIDEDSYDADMIFFTGDISQDETTESYQKAVNILSKLNIPVYWIPGNHDNIMHMERVFQHTKNFNRAKHLSLSAWHFIFLNTKLEGAAEGYLSQQELAMLNDELVASPAGKKIAIVMHHHPAPVGTPLIDNYMLKNAKAFWDIVTKIKVELIICGHVHGDYTFKHSNIMIESSPATCLQWERGTKDLKIDKRVGYKVYHFGRDGYRATAKVW
jgi:3',5'-cyclic-AMP phosphodiesterase